jgi:hypothetical protein
MTQHFLLVDIGIPLAMLGIPLKMFGKAIPLFWDDSSVSSSVG